MTIKDGWLSWAERVHGPANKVYAQPNAGEGLALHSAEGWYAGMLGELMKPERQASWMFSNLLDGRFIQHYPITASTWASGNVAANTRLWSVESEGVAGTPLNALQVANMMRLGEEWEEHTGLKLVRNPDRSIGTLWEHGQCWNWSQPNAGPTACPSNRYLPFYEAWENREEDEVTKEEFDAFKAKTESRLAQLETQVWGEAGVPRDGDPKTAAPGYAGLNMYELSAGRVAKGAPDHTHEVTVTLK